MAAMAHRELERERASELDRGWNRVTATPNSWWATASTAATTVNWTANYTSTNGNVWTTNVMPVTYYTAGNPYTDWERNYQRIAQYEAQRTQVTPGRMAEEQQRDAARRAQYAQEADDRYTRRTQANERARALLLSCLNAEQRAALERDRKFRVIGSAGGIYEIQQGRTHNINKLDAQGRITENWCVHVEATVPDCDNMLAQKLDLETNEIGLRRQANIWARPSGLMIQSAERQARHVEAQTLDEMLEEHRRIAA